VRPLSSAATKRVELLRILWPHQRSSAHWTPGQRFGPGRRTHRLGKAIERMDPRALAVLANL